MKIYLIGFMGAGKTTVGLELSRRLGLPFFDLDELIEASEGMAIREIFAEKGEPYFRRREMDLLRSTQHLEHGVVATGGGTFTFEENSQFVLAHGLSIFLQAPISVLMGRISEKAAERPMFRDEASLRELYQYRLRYYKMADITLDIREDESVTEVTERMIMQLPKELFGALSRRPGRNV
ncbi:MAG: shikimate kinase [Thermoanaerobaculia bacterium]